MYKKSNDSHTSKMNKKSKQNREYSYYLDTQNSVNTNAGGVIYKDEHINTDTQT